MSDGADELAELRAENARLLKEAARSERRIRQLERLAHRSGLMAEQRRAALSLSVDELETKSAALEEALLAKDRFLATMSHEIRTPMNGVIGYVELLECEDLGPHAKDMVRTLKSSAEVLLLLLNDVLDFSKIQAGELSLETVPFDVSELMRDIVALESARASAKGIALETRVAPSLGSSVLGDPLRVRQVLANLLSNAIKFTDTGSVTVTAECGGDPGDDLVRFSVKDTGIGMGPDVQEHVFSPFTQADESTTRRFGGTGLGLSISRPLVEAMGGELRVESAEGVGSEFWFRVPLPSVRKTSVRESRALKSSGESAADTGEAADASAQGLARDQGGDGDVRRDGLSLTGMRVLLVDDTPLNLRLGRRLLESLGCAVSEACSGLAAVEAARTSAFDAVLMDCSMPEVDGFEATKMIRGLPGERGSVPVVALTALALDGDRARCLDAGMDDYLPKPVRLAALKQTLFRALDRRSRRAS